MVKRQQQTHGTTFIKALNKNVKYKMENIIFYTNMQKKRTEIRAKVIFWNGTCTGMDAINLLGELLPENSTRITEAINVGYEYHDGAFRQCYEIRATQDEEKK